MGDALVDFLYDSFDRKCWLNKRMQKATRILLPGEYFLLYRKTNYYLGKKVELLKTWFGFLLKENENGEITEKYYLTHFRPRATQNPVKDMAIIYVLKNGKISYISAVSPSSKKGAGRKQTSKIIKYLKNNPIEMIVSAKISSNEELEETETWRYDENVREVVRKREING